jgi:hypothetical protein
MVIVAQQSDESEPGYAKPGNFGKPDIKTAWEKNGYRRAIASSKIEVTFKAIWSVFGCVRTIAGWSGLGRGPFGLLAYSSQSSAAVFGPGSNLDAGLLARRYDESAREGNEGGGVLQKDIGRGRD